MGFRGVRGQYRCRGLLRGVPVQELLEQLRAHGGICDLGALLSLLPRGGRDDDGREIVRRDHQHHARGRRARLCVRLRANFRFDRDQSGRHVARRQHARQLDIHGGVHALPYIHRRDALRMDALTESPVPLWRAHRVVRLHPLPDRYARRCARPHRRHPIDDALSCALRAWP